MALPLISLVSVFLALAMVIVPQEGGWRGIVPLHSTRADVEKLLGRANDSGYGVTYAFEDESVTFEYSSCRCCKPIEYRWDVAEYTVIRIRVSSVTKPRFSALNIDKEKFKKIVDSHLPDWTIYRNNDEGVSYEVLNDLVVTTEYGPSAKDSKALRCDKRAVD
jgi:hypothetical protein